MFCITNVDPTPSQNMRRGKARPKTSRRRNVVNSQALRLSDTALQPSVGNSRIHRFSQWIADTFAVQAAVTPTFLTFAPALSSLDQAPQFTSIFDQYRIVRIEHEFRPMYTANSIGTFAEQIPLIYTVVDYDDNTAPAAIADLRRYENCQVHQNETFTISYVPHCANALYSGTFASYGNVTSPWIDCASATVPHYGMKLGINPGPSGQAHYQTWNIATRLTVEFKNVR